METRALRYFQTVAEFGSYSRGSEFLRISQPAVSRQIRKLEEELGHALFKRHGHGVSLTHLNGRTVADLVLERRTDLTDVFFVNRRTIPWPPRPLQGLLVKGILGFMHYEDRRDDPKPAGG